MPTPPRPKTSKPRPKTKRERVANLFRDALAAAQQGGMTIEELADLTGEGRGPVGALVRGEVARPTPKLLNEVTKWLPTITVAQILEAYGFKLAIKPQQRLPPALVAGLLELKRDDPEKLQSLVQLFGKQPTDGTDGAGQE